MSVFTGDQKSEEECVNYIDKHITVERDETNQMQDLIGYQIHKHSHTCRKGRRNVNKCRFNFPKPPLNLTMVLRPLSADTPLQQLRKANQNYKRIVERLNELGSNYKEDMEFEEFLEMLGISIDEYLLAIRSSIIRTTVFLKRKTSEIFVNPYNKKLLLLWKANMDIQFVLDPYACAKYVVGYVAKAEGGCSKLLREAAKDVRKGNSSIREHLLKFAKIMMTASEIGAQEAAGFLLGLPNTLSSRQDIYINTSPKLERIGILKSKEELSKLPNDSQDVLEKGLIDHYSQRPNSLENICLAEFAACYEFHKRGRKKQSDNLTGSDTSGMSIKFFINID